MPTEWPRRADLEPRVPALSVPALVAAVAWVTGDLSLLEGPRPVHCTYNGGLEPPDRDVLRERVLAAIDAWHARGGRHEPLDDGQLRSIMGWVAAEHVDDDYAEMFLEEIDLEQRDPRRITLQHRDRATAPRDDLLVAVVGCGVSGILAGVRLAQAGIPFVIIEKNDDVGGTWLENTYPGCRVDVPSQSYSYSFAPYDFSHHFAQQPALHDYLRGVVEQFGLQPHIRWSTDVEVARWIDRTATWELELRTPQRTDRLEANAVISAVGQLNRPNIPAIEGLDEFDGPVFHSARWDHTVDHRGARVALIGAGASGFQIAPAIANEVDQLVVFQRSAQWMVPNPLYHRTVKDDARWALAALPGYAAWLRFSLMWQARDVLELARIDPAWSGLPHSTNETSAQRRAELEAWMAHHVGDDPALLAKVVPDYPPLGKRMLQDDGSWLECLKRPNVTLEREPIERIERDAVVAGGRRYPVDVIVLATGFRANEFLTPMTIIGRGGTTLHDRWAGKPAAYVGVTVPGFPNLFLMYGPGTNLAHGGSIIFHAECQMRYIGDCLRLLAEGSVAAVEPTEQAFTDYVERLRAELSQYVWSHPAVRHSWYKADDGEVYVLSPWRLVDYWRMTAGVDPADHVFHGAEVPESR